MARTALWGLVCLALAGLGCTGQFGEAGAGPAVSTRGTDGTDGGGGDGQATGGSDGQSTGGPVAKCGPSDVRGAPVPMRRLTAPQLSASVEDVLGVGVSYLVADETLIGFRANTSSRIDTATARMLMTTAEQVADQLASQLPGDPRCAEDCASYLLDEVAPRLFRHPLDDATRASLLAVHAQGIAAEGVPGGVRWLVTAMLQSPHFLYLLEDGDDTGHLSSYAIAARLAYALWAGPPDAALLAEAAAGELQDAASVRQSAARMMDDARFERGMRAFADQWLSLEHLDDATARPDVAALAADTRAAMVQQPGAFLVHHVREGSSLAEVLETSTVPSMPALAELYGADLLADDADVMQLDASRRAGLLSLPGVLAALSHAHQTAPTLRGRVVLANLLCRPPPPPPANVVTTLPPAAPGATTRERLLAHQQDPSCAGCHRSMDGVGFTFEGFDWLGRSRDTDNGKPIDTTAEFSLGVDVVAVDDATELAQVLAERADVAQCISRQFSRYATGIAESDRLDCAMDTLSDAAASSGGLREMLLQLVSLPWFRERSEQEMP